MENDILYKYLYNFKIWLNDNNNLSTTFKLVENSDLLKAHFIKLITDSSLLKES